MPSSGDRRGEQEIPVSILIIEKVAAQEEVDPTDVTQPMHEVIDPDALDALCSTEQGTAESEVQVTFNYCGYRIMVHGDGRVSVIDSNRPSTQDSGFPSGPPSSVDD